MTVNITGMTGHSFTEKAAGLEATERTFVIVADQCGNPLSSPSQEEIL